MSSISFVGYISITSGFPSTGPSQSFRLFGDLRPDFGKTCTPQWPFSRAGSSSFSPCGYGVLPPMQNAECMEEDKILSLSATPSYENTSPEELRWEEYQAKKAATFQMTLTCPPLQTSSCFELQSKKASSLEWPQHSLQMCISSVPSPITTITSSSSSSGTGVDYNISTQRPLSLATPANDFAVPSEISLAFSNVESGISVQHGISSLPDFDKCCQSRTISLLTSKQVFQKTVIRMQTRRHGGRKEGPRVCFLNDYKGPEDSRNRDAAAFVARENPNAFLLHTPWLENGGTQKGTYKDN